MKTVWRPQKKQAEFLCRDEYEVLYGGAAGGGKSDALLAEALRQVNVPHYRALILRKTYMQLTELADRSKSIYKAAFPSAVYNETKHMWEFLSGAKIYFGSMQYPKDRVNYQGKRYDFIGFDELTQFTYGEYSYMFSRNRPGGKGTKCYIRATANPGGIGHGWVKERFIAPAPPLSPICEKYSVIMPTGKKEIFERTRVFVPSTVFDNEELLKNDPDYLCSLSMLPENEKRALLYGDWDCFEGQVFLSFKNDSTGYESRINTHVIKPFRIPDNFKVIRGFDFGYTKPFSVGWYAISPDGVIYRIREYYGCTDTPNTGLKLTPQEIALKIREIEEEDENLSGRSIFGIADPSIFDKSRGKSIAESMSECGVYFVRGDNTRLAGKMQFHYRLHFDSRGVPGFYVFNTCREFIRTIPELVYSSTNTEDIDTEGEDHIYDECRYVFMAYPLKPPKKEEEKQEINTDALIFWNL